MSRKSAGDQMAEDLAGGCIFVVFLALWAAIAGLIAAIVKSTQTTPEEQLRNMGALPIFGARIRSVSCQNCGEQNEDAALMCFQCGSSIEQVLRPVDSSEPQDFKRPASVKELGERPSILVKGKTFKEMEFIIVGFVFAILLTILILGFLSSS